MYMITKHIICDLTGYRPASMDVSQGDRMTRAVACSLLENGVPWVVSEDVRVQVAYTLPDGTPGLYDTMPDGTPAGEISGNVVTVLLSDHMMAMSGIATMSVVLIGPGGEQLASWPVLVNVQGAKKMTTPENLPALGSKFVGTILYGGPDGGLTPLSLGDGVRVERLEDGNLRLVAEGGIHEETDPTVPGWAKQPSKPSYTAEEVGADPVGTALNNIAAHDTGRYSHEDIRQELRVLADRVSVALDSNETGLDQLSEIVAYIKSNKALIDAITTSKVSVADIVDNLVTNVSNKPLSAAMGVALAGDIDSLKSALLLRINGLQNDMADLEAAATSKVSVGDIVNNLVTNASNKPLSAAMGVALAGDIDSLNSALLLRINGLKNDMAGLLPRQELPDAVDDALAQVKDAICKQVELINHFVVEEDVQRLDIDRDSDGNPLNLTFAVLRLTCGNDVAAGNSGAGSVFFYFDSDFARAYTTGFNYHGYEVSEGNYRPAGIFARCDMRDGVVMLRGFAGDTGYATVELLQFPGEDTKIVPNASITKVRLDFVVPRNAQVWIYGVRRSE